MKTYGPYYRENGRAIVIHYENGKTKTQSYPRFLMEKHLGRTLEPKEHVDHINNDHRDNRIENFQLLSPAKNLEKYHEANPAIPIDLICSNCEKPFQRSAQRFNSNTKKNSKNYCSRSCASRHAGIASGKARRKK